MQEASLDVSQQLMLVPDGVPLADCFTTTMPTGIETPEYKPQLSAAQNIALTPRMLAHGVALPLDTAPSN